MARGPACALLLWAVTGLGPATAAAQDLDVAGALTASFISSDGDPGGIAMLDVWAPIGVLRLGGFVGAGAIFAERDSHNRVMMPVGASVALVFDGDLVFSLRGRGGVWGGATQDVKLTLGGFLGGGAGMSFHVSPGATVGAVVEVWGILGAGETWAIVPGLTLEWGHPVAAVETDSDRDEEP